MNDCLTQHRAAFVHGPLHPASAPSVTITFRLPREHAEQVEATLCARRTRMPWVTKADVLRELVALALESTLADPMRR